ncbi:hypothetical protein MFMK1_001879 [Metallumcola ferriviriculae]|uniref:50S ribosomal protein L29 n=1 Tax=Metallumcola ferriviriculae TaxID=3039180 RepID=A0AAU0UL19_9FIRM|nr:hypothetical protein MFMK1_001879 [Desulfitibacteraceae bacterium MK1]
MKPAKPWDDLTKEELVALLKEHQELCEEIEEEMDFVLKHSSCHLPGNTRAKYEQQLAGVTDRIKRLKKLLGE